MKRAKTDLPVASSIAQDRRPASNLDPYVVCK